MEASLNGPFGRNTLGASALNIGRAPDNTVVINDPQASSHHAVIAPGYGGNGYQVTDLNSTNGTFVNDQRLTPNAPRPLNNGDVIRIGALLFTYEASSGYAPTVVASGFNSSQTVADQPQAAQATLYPQAAYEATPPPPPMPPVQPPVYQQPGYPQYQPANFNQSAYPLPQPGAGQPYPPKKRSRAGLWITLIVLLLVVVGGGIGGFVYLQNRSTPEKTLQAYCTALKNNDAQGIYNTMSTAEQQQTDLNKISTGLNLLKLLTGGFTDCTYSNVTVNGNNATARLILTPVRGNTLNSSVALVNENGQWKMTTNKALPAG